MADEGGNLALDQFVSAVLERTDSPAEGARQIARILAATQAIASDAELADTLAELVGVACDLLGIGYGALAVIASDGMLEDFVQHGLPQMHVTDLSEISDDDGILVIPVGAGGATHGTLYLAARSGHEFAPEDVHLATAIAALAGTVIANVRLFEDARLAGRWVAASEEINRRLLSADATDSDVTFIAGLVIDLANAAFVGLVLPDATGFTVQYGPLSYNATLDRSPEFLALPGIVSATLTGNPGAPDLHAIEQSARANVTGFGPTMIIPWGEDDDAFEGAFVVSRGATNHQFSAAERQMAERFVRSVSIARELASRRTDRERVALADERDRIARDLHDHVIQSLFAVGLGLQSIVGQATGQVQARVSAQIDAIDVTIRQIRQTIFQLNSVPSTLAYSQKQQLNQLVRTILEGHSIDSSLDFSGPVDTLIDSALGAEVSAVLREALSNVVRHADASRVDISVAVSTTGVRVVVTDNGRGLGELARSSGLRNLAARAQELGGTFAVAGRAPSGTTLDWSVPVT